MLSYRIDAAARIVHFEGPTPTDPGEFARVCHAALTDPAFKPGFGFYRDRRGQAVPATDIVHRSVAALRQVEGLPTSKWAIVVDPGANYGMLRMMQLLTDGTWVEVGLFYDPMEATRWLGEQLQGRAAVNSAEPNADG